VYVVVNIGSVLYRVCVLDIVVCGCKCMQCALWGVFIGNYFGILRETNDS